DRRRGPAGGGHHRCAAAGLPRGRLMERYGDRVALVTGAGHGIGAAVVHRLHAEGATVVLADRDRGAAEAVARELDPGRVLVVSCDITDPGSVDAAVTATDERFGRLDVLVSVAGGSLA